MGKTHSDKRRFRVVGDGLELIGEDGKEEKLLRRVK
jgi:hypothetical protein